MGAERGCSAFLQYFGSLPGRVGTSRQSPRLLASPQQELRAPEPSRGVSAQILHLTVGAGEDPHNNIRTVGQPEVPGELAHGSRVELDSSCLGLSMPLLRVRSPSERSTLPAAAGKFGLDSCTVREVASCQLPQGDSFVVRRRSWTQCVDSPVCVVRAARARRC